MIPQTTRYELINTYHVFTRMPSGQWWGSTNVIKGMWPGPVMAVYITPCSDPDTRLGNLVTYTPEELKSGDAWVQKVKDHCEEAYKLYQLLS